MNNVMQFPNRRAEIAAERDPWRHAQPIMVDKGDREELWSDTYFGIRTLIWATGSNHVPEPPSPTGGTPAAANVVRYGKLRVAA